MPLVRITLAKGSASGAARAVADGVHRALVAVAGVPDDDRFQIVEEVPAENLMFSPSYLGIERRGPAAFIQIHLNAGRTVEVKQALFARIADNLAADPGLRKEDVVVNLVEVAREDWSFGGGLMSYPPART